MKDFEIKNDKILIHMKHSLYDDFCKNIMPNLNDGRCIYFTHQLIKKYRQKDHYVSSFCTNLEWQDEYWHNHWDNDPEEKLIHKIALDCGTSVTFWHLMDEKSKLMEWRLKRCRFQQHLLFSRRLNDDVLENYTFGWQNFDTANLNRDKLGKLSTVIDAFRLKHFGEFCEANK